MYSEPSTGRLRPVAEVHIDSTGIKDGGPSYSQTGRNWRSDDRLAMGVTVIVEVINNG